MIDIWRIGSSHHSMKSRDTSSLPCRRRTWWMPCIRCLSDENVAQRLFLREHESGYICYNTSNHLLKMNASEAKNWSREILARTILILKAVADTPLSSQLFLWSEGLCMTSESLHETISACLFSISSPSLTRKRSADRTKTSSVGNKATPLSFCMPSQQ